MTNTPNTTISNNLYPLANGTSSSNPFVWEFQPRDPTVNDYNYPIQKLWLNTANNNIWFLKNFVSSVGVVTANWIFLATGSAVLETLTGDDGIPVLPVSNNINELGNAVANATHAKPIFFRSGGNPNLDLDVQVSAAAASSNINKAGLASFNNSEFTVDANGFVQLIGGGEAIDSVGVDASTVPGTNPVLPNVSGEIFVTGGQVAAGTTANVIQTNSLAANTYTVQVQRSQAVASSTIGDNGVSHFNSADFTVDSNGFVSLVSGSLNYTNVTHAMSPYTVLSTDYFISVDCSAGIVQLNFPNAPTFKQQWVIKDRTGNAAVSNITLTTPGGTVTFDGLTTYTMNSNYQATNLLANATPTYEVF